MILPAKFHVVSSLLTVLKIEIDASVKVPIALPLKMSFLENETTVNLESASFVVIMFLHECLTHIQSQIKPRLHFGESFTLRYFFLFFTLKSLRGGSLIASVEYCRNTRFMYKSALIYTGKRRLLFSLIILKKILIAQLEGCQKLTPFMYGLVSDERHFLYGIQSVTGPCFTQETPLKTEVKTVEKWPEREQEMGNRC